MSESAPEFRSNPNSTAFESKHVIVDTLSERESIGVKYSDHDGYEHAFYGSCDEAKTLIAHLQAGIALYEKAKGL